MKKGDMVMIIRSQAGNEGKIGTVVGPAPTKGPREDFQPRMRVYVFFPRPVRCTRGELHNPAPAAVVDLKRLDPDVVKDEVAASEELQK